MSVALNPVSPPRLAVGALVVVHIPPTGGTLRSTFHGQRGVVVGIDPVLVQLEGEARPLHFGEESLAKTFSRIRKEGA